MLKIGVISNIFAKQLKNDPQYNIKLSQLLGVHGQFEVTRSLAELEQVCKDFKHKKVNLVGIVGGDGTISTVLTALNQVYSPGSLPRILFLKSGTTNFMASNLGLKTNAKECLEDFLMCVDKNQTLYEKKFRALVLDSKKLGFIFGSGLVSEFLNEFYKNKTSKFGSSFEAFKMAADFILGGKLNGKYAEVTKSRVMTIETLPNQIDLSPGGRYSLVLASTVPKMPLGLPLFKYLSQDSDKAQLIISDASGSSILSLVRKIIFRRAVENAKHVYSINFSSAKITSFDQKLFSLDGELIENENGLIDLRVGPEVTFVSPYKII